MLAGLEHLGMLVSMDLHPGAYVFLPPLHGRPRDADSWPEVVEDYFLAKSRSFRATHGRLPYVYQVLSGGRFRVVCLGADGAPGGTGVDADIVITGP